MSFSICRTAGRAFVAATTLLAAKPLAVVAAPVAPARFPTASGVIQYRMAPISPMTSSGSTTITWTNYGTRFRLDSKTRINAGARPKTMNSWSLYDGKSLYTLSDEMPCQTAGRKVALRIALPTNYSNYMLSGSAATGGRVVGHGTILGKPCEIRIVAFNNPGSAGQAKIWMWKGLLLRSETTMSIKVTIHGTTRTSLPVKMSMVATQLNTNVKPSPSLFRLPAGYQVQEMSDFQKQMQARMQQRR